jgi:hypothetical protein
MSEYIYLVVWEEWSLTQVSAGFSSLEEAIKWKDQANSCASSDNWCIRKLKIFNQANDCELYKVGNLSDIRNNKDYQGEKIEFKNN